MSKEIHLLAGRLKVPFTHVMTSLYLFPTDPPYISKAKNMGVSVGQKGILSCEASAVPTAEFQWFREDTRYRENGNRAACAELMEHFLPGRRGM